MPKITKHAEFLDTLRTMMTKQANGPTATGKPGADTHPESSSEKNDHVDKNTQGHPEKNPQAITQKPSTDVSAPTEAKCATEHTPEAKAEEKAEMKAPAPAGLPDTTKSKAFPGAAAPYKAEQKAAEELPAGETHTKLAALGAELTKLMAEMQKQANGPTATGKPGADTHPESSSEKNDHVDKNTQGHPEKNPQAITQKPSTDKSEPSKPKSAAAQNEEVEKLASFELGRQFARSMLKQAQEEAVVSQTKTAGRRDFEQLIAQAAAELEQQEAEKQGAAMFDEMAYNEKQAEAQAEEAGAHAFNDLYKVAQYEHALTIAKQSEEQLNEKLAAEYNARVAAERYATEAISRLNEKEASLNEKLATEKRASEMNAWASIIMDGVVDKLHREATRSNSR